MGHFLLAEFNDKTYSAYECYQKCYDTVDCGGYFLDKNNNSRCILVKPGCSQHVATSHQYTYYEKCGGCPKTWDGGCENYQHFLLAEFNDKTYSSYECYQKCYDTVDCGGYFLDKNNSRCILVKPGCSQHVATSQEYTYYEQCWTA